jgi:hypothetical protein
MGRGGDDATDPRIITMQQQKHPERMTPDGIAPTPIAPPRRSLAPGLPNPREVLRAARAEALGLSMAQRVF